MTNAHRHRIGRWRASLRVRLGLTQAELASAAGVSVGAVSRAEQGHDPHASTARSIAFVLDEIPPGRYLAPSSATLATTGQETT